jgi:HAD superfamily hydrolase (TIGR01450 family)
VRPEREEGLVPERFEAFLFDVDGVVCLGNEPLPRARESLALLRRAGKGIRFLTNDPRPTRAETSARLKGMGIEARVEEVVSSGWATAGYLAEEGISAACVIGSESLRSEIRGADVEVADAVESPEAVVVGGDERASYWHVEAAAGLISAGARFVATNPDGSFPVPGGRAPGTGALVAAVAAASGRRPDEVVGKPSPRMFELALAGVGAPPERIAVVGDDPETDVLGAHRSGLTAILVSKSPSVSPSPRDFRVPDATIPDLALLLDPGIEVGAWEKPPFEWPERVAAGVAAVVFDDAGGVLLGRRADNGLWGLPSGHVEPGETVKEGAVREVAEETGLVVEAQRLVGVYSDPASQVFAYPGGEVVQFVTCCFRCRVLAGEPRPDGEETVEVAFFDLKELPPDLLPMHPRWLSDALPYEGAISVR